MHTASTTLQLKSTASFSKRAIELLAYLIIDSLDLVGELFSSNRRAVIVLLPIVNVLLLRVIKVVIIIKSLNNVVECITLFVHLAELAPDVATVVEIILLTLRATFDDTILERRGSSE